MRFDSKGADTRAALEVHRNHKLIIRNQFSSSVTAFILICKTLAYQRNVHEKFVKYFLNIKTYIINKNLNNKIRKKNIMHQYRTYNLNHSLHSNAKSSRRKGIETELHNKLCIKKLRYCSKYNKQHIQRFKYNIIYYNNIFSVICFYLKN